MATYMDLNADLGEGFGAWSLGDDEALLEVITSANVACGFHAGDPSIMRRVCAQAAQRGIAIGAQVSYRDLAGFGRRFIDVAPDELSADVLYQLAALDGIARTEGTAVAYVKPHGALYNAIVTHEAQALAVASAVRDFDGTLPALGLPGSAWLARAGDLGLATVGESFADRAYAADATLVPRRQAGAVLHDAEVIAARSVRMATHGLVEAIDGSTVEVRAASICVHGDTPGAAVIAARVRAALVAAGVTITAFAAV